MNRLKKAYCRTYQTVFKLALPFLPYRTPEVVGSVKKLSAHAPSNRNSLSHR